MQEIELKQTTELAPLLCQRCGCEMRLIGSESHPDQDRTDLLTYWCTRCDDYETRDAAGEIVFKQMSARENGERVLEAIPKHPVCPRCDVPMWLLKFRPHWKKSNIFTNAKGAKEKSAAKEMLRNSD
jgi:hypothetical protein